MNDIEKLIEDFEEAVIGRDEDDIDAARAALLAAIPVSEQKPVAWMHDQESLIDVIHAEVKDLWLRVGQPIAFYRESEPCKVEHYTIPLFTRPPVSEWQPIETAPKDGTDVLALMCAGFIEIVCWDARYNHTGAWCSARCVDGLEAGEPTHWMPLPPNPTAMSRI